VSAPDVRRDLARLVAEPTSFLTHPDPHLRRLAVSALTGTRTGTIDQFASALADEVPTVRAEAAEALGHCGAGALPALDGARRDVDTRVVEATATAYGEIGDPIAVDWLIQQAEDADDRGVREAAVAALGAIGDERARSVLIALTASGPPQIRRRAVVALTVFDGADVETAIAGAGEDRNPMVREAAQMIVGRSVPEAG